MASTFVFVLRVTTQYYVATVHRILATKYEDVKPNVAYGKTGTGCDDVKYVQRNVAYGKVNILGT